ncbi:MAG TPA: DUF1015 domain-containing protein [Phycisphaerae bacterium]|nr:DUF1015 domain-containing protein [Phycisphaerae bacterium]
MAVIKPFAAIRYPQAQQTDLVSPPYDVLTAKDKDRLLQKNPHNIVEIDLPHVPPKNAGPQEVYHQAGKTLQHWITTGVLQRDGTETLYPYQQLYTHDGVTYRRRGLFCRVKLEEFGPAGMIHPHEQTFSGPKEDRLLLMRATRANLSPVFGLYDDPTNTVTDRLFGAISGLKLLASAELPSMDGKSAVISELWSLKDPEAMAAVQKLMAPKHIYIADGHHRYSTCLNYRNETVQNSGGQISPEHPVNFAMFVLIAMQDPGLIVLPTHRVTANLRNFSCEAFLKAGGNKLKKLSGPLPGSQLSELEKKLPTFGKHAMGIYDPGRDEVVIAATAESDPLAAAGSDKDLAGKSPAWRQLDVAILQHLIFDQIVIPHFAADQNLQWAFPHEAHEVLELCRSGHYQAGFLLQPTPLDAVKQLCNANELMPQKSTFFYPKLATGMVINPLW